MKSESFDLKVLCYRLAINNEVMGFDAQLIIICKINSIVLLK